MDYSLTNEMNCFTGFFAGAQQQGEREKKEGKRKNINEIVKHSNPSLISVKVLLFNVRSLKKYYGDVEALLNCLKSPPPRFLCFSETSLENSDNNVLYQDKMESLVVAESIEG